MQHTILVVDDEKDVVALLRDNFTMLGYLVLTATGYDEAVEKAARGPDIILLDVNMPGRDGLSVCRAIRRFVRCPILFLTARVADADKIEGFAAGGDDYVTKPFSLDELSARVAAHLRREERPRNQARVWFGGDVAVDYLEKAVYVRGERVPLAKKEYEIVELLSRTAARCLTRSASTSGSGAGRERAPAASSPSTSSASAQSSCRPARRGRSKPSGEWATSG